MSTTRRGFLGALIAAPVLWRALPSLPTPVSAKLLRTGGTLKDLATWNENFAAAEFGKVFNRQLFAYDRAYQENIRPLWI